MDLVEQDVSTITLSTDAQLYIEAWSKVTPWGENVLYFNKV